MSIFFRLYAKKVDKDGWIDGFCLLLNLVCLEESKNENLRFISQLITGKHTQGRRIGHQITHPFNLWAGVRHVTSAMMELKYLLAVSLGVCTLNA